MMASQTMANPARRATAALLPLLFVACESVRQGPELTVHNPEGHRVYLDGRELPTRQRPRPLPFRYYGTTRWDALPVIPMQNGVPVFDRELRSELVEVPLPAPRWLFPFDFAIELVDRTLFGRRDQDVVVRVPEHPPATHLDADGIQAMRTRGHEARIAR